MNKILAIFFVLMSFCSITAIAQPTFSFPTEERNAGENFCIDVRVTDFTDILTMNYIITWDPNVIEFTGTANLNLQDLDTGDFDLTNISNGELTLDWADVSMTGVTLFPDGQSIFQLCFRAIGSFGNNSPVCIKDDPMPIITRTGTGGVNIGLFQDKGFIGIEVLPVKISADNVIANDGDFVCVDFRVENFINIVAMQFTIEYDPDILEFDGINNYNVLPRLSPSANFINIQPGVVTFSWNTTNQSVTLPDSTAVFAVCFRAVGDCNSYSSVRVTGDWTSIEVVTSDEPVPGSGINIGVIPEDGSVRINPCTNTGLNLIGTCPEGAPGETVCVDISVRRFDNIRELDFLIKWNPNVIEYVGHTILAPGFNAIVNTTGSSVGTIRVSWSSRSPTLGLDIPDGNDLLQVCFRIIGDGTINSSVSFTGNPAVVTQVGGNQNIGLDADNGCVLVQAPPGLTLSASEHEGFNSQEVCVDVLGANFDGINSMQLTIAYEANLLQFNSVTDFAIPGMGAANITDLGGGFLEVSWDTPSGFGEILPDGTVLFRLCFTLIGDPGQCSTISFIGDPVPIHITTEESGNFNIGLNNNPGEICILDPGGFTVIGGTGSGDPGEVVCLDVKVANFNSLLTTQYSLNWDVSIASFSDLEFTGALPAFTDANFDFSNIGVGILTLSWQDPSGGGISLPDSTVIFRICLELTGDANSCSELGFAEDPLDILVVSAFSGGENIGLNQFNGEICVSDYLRVLDSLVLDVDCPGSNSGAINLRMIGGNPPYDFLWTPTGATTSSIANIPEGTYEVRIRDNSDPVREINLTFDIGVSGVAPLADAGQNMSLNCNTLPTRLDGSGSSSGPNIKYLWRTLTSGGIVPPGERTLNPTVLGQGLYELRVTNALTGCFSTDTVEVTDPVFPTAMAGADQAINCIDPDAVLDASSSIGNSLTYSWTAFGPDADLENGTENLSRAIALGPGLYEVLVVDRFSGCSDVDTVEVIFDTLPPVADAGPRMSLPCIADTLILGGVNTSLGIEFIYEWVNRQNGNIIGPRNESSVSVNTIGLYELTVTDTTNGCMSSDTVRVTGDPDRPEANAGPDTVLTCQLESVTLMGSIIPQGGPIIFEWTAFSGGVIPPGQEGLLNPIIEDPGLYQLMVRDTITGCDDFSSVVVTQNRQIPRALAGADINLGCQDIAVPLDGQGSSSGPDITYLWSTSDGGTIQGDTSLSPTVQGAGLYILTVENLSNGCVAMDSVSIFQDSTGRPQLTIAPPSGKLNCRDSVVQLNAIGSSNGPNLSISWGPANAIVSGNNTLTPRVNRAGTYTLTILNNDDNCFSTGTVVVEIDTIHPFADAGEDVTLRCSQTSLRLDGNNSSAGGLYTYDWSGDSGQPIVNEDTRTPQIFGPGLYTLMVINRQNHCSDSDSVLIDEAIQPLVSLTGDTLLDCAVTSVDLSASGSSSGPSVIYEWTEQDGTVLGRGEDLSVGDPGWVLLAVRDTLTDCTTLDSIFVSADVNSPVADAGEDQIFNCGFEETILSGSGDAMGRTISFEWFSPDGNTVLNNTDPEATVNLPGEYILIVTDEVNHCTGSDTILVDVQFNLPLASATADGDNCEDFGQLNGNLPAGTSGQWTSLGEGLIDQPGEALTMVTDLEGGSSQFIWTLSTADCPDYSSDTVRLETAYRPFLRNEFLSLQEDKDSLEVFILTNDDLPAGGQWILQIGEDPPIMVNDPGTVSWLYLRQDGFAGEVELNYVVCNQLCPNFCDTAFVRINVETRPVSIDSLPPNAITPNDDGLNETLYFDIMDQGGPYPDNELIIFNRWGDIVYQAKPYLNDWRGTNPSGGDLPQGTYYYILRLNISEGIIFRGDVTLLR